MEYLQLALYALIAAMVMLFWKGSQWVLASTRAARESESLTPADLGTLREACEVLIQDLREAADLATAQVENSVRKAELIHEKLSELLPDVALVSSQNLSEEQGHSYSLRLEKTASEPKPLTPEPDFELNEFADPMDRIYFMADSGMNASEIARRENRPAGEIKLILDLRKLQAENSSRLTA